MSKHRKISLSRRKMYSLAAGTVLAAAGTAGVAAADGSGHQGEVPRPVPVEEVSVPEEAPVPVPAEEVSVPQEAPVPVPAEEVSVPTPIEELSPAERANAVG